MMFCLPFFDNCFIMKTIKRSVYDIDSKIIEQDNLLDNLVTLEEYIEKHENQKFVEVQIKDFYPRSRENALQFADDINNDLWLDGESG